MGRNMDSNTQTILKNLHAEDGAVRYEALNAILAITAEPVDWAYTIGPIPYGMNWLRR